MEETNTVDGEPARTATEPHFEITARAAIPVGLEDLNPATEVTWSQDLAGWANHSATRAGTLLAELRATMAMQSRGYFHVPEASQILADAHGHRGKRMLEEMETAICSGALKIVSGELLLQGIPQDFGRASWSWADYVRPDHINAWLKARGATDRFPSGAASTAQSVQSRAAKAAPKQRVATDASSAPTTAANARWAHLPEYKVKALAEANSKPFASRAKAAEHAADMLEDKPDMPGKRYSATTVDEWLREASWTAHKEED